VHPFVLKGIMQKDFIYSSSKMPDESDTYFIETGAAKSRVFFYAAVTKGAGRWAVVVWKRKGLRRIRRPGCFTTPEASIDAVFFAIGF
jgi:hypothetical protein